MTRIIVHGTSLMSFVDLVSNGRLGIPDGSERAVMFTVLSEHVASLFPERVPFGDVAFRALAGQVWPVPLPCSIPP